ncbi:MAG TPA: hypothetical protein VMU21_12855, partial [Thermodesulfovibrionales bacterium]|nr:hypothetical protein [Thermodesulfovibrionales bacterium]
STTRPPPQTEAARRWSQSIISATLKSPLSEACPDALAVMDISIEKPSISNRNPRESRYGLPAFNVIDKSMRVAMRMSQTDPKWVLRITVGSIGKAAETGWPLISEARISNSATLLATITPKQIPNNRHMEARIFP